MTPRMTCDDGPASCNGRPRPEDDAAKAATVRDLRITEVRVGLVEAMRYDQAETVKALRAELAWLRGETSGPATAAEGSEEA